MPGELWFRAQPIQHLKPQRLCNVMALHHATMPATSGRSNLAQEIWPLNDRVAVLDGVHQAMLNDALTMTPTAALYDRSDSARTTFSSDRKLPPSSAYQTAKILPQTGCSSGNFTVQTARNVFE